MKNNFSESGGLASNVGWLLTRRQTFGKLGKAPVLLVTWFAVQWVATPVVVKSGATGEMVFITSTIAGLLIIIEAGTSK